MSWPESIHTVYVICNAEKEEARAKRILPHLLMTGVPKERLKLCGPTWGDTLDVRTIFNVYDPYLHRGNLPAFSFQSARLSRGEISLNLNFFTAIQNARDISDNECIMILESDTYLRRDFIPRLNDIMRDLSGQEWDYVSLSEGNCINSRPKEHGSYYAPTKLFEPRDSWCFRCTDSMILSKRFVQKLLTTFIPFKEPLDWELNFQMLLHQGVPFWADPPLAEQGSMVCKLKTELL